MAALSQQEKAAGRIFRDQARLCMRRYVQLLPEAVPVPAELHHVRHVCTNHKGRTWGMELKEHRILNPAMEGLEAGKLAWIWRQGACSCGFAAYADDGRMVAEAERPAMRGAVIVILDPAGL